MFYVRLLRDGPVPRQQRLKLRHGESFGSVVPVNEPVPRRRQFLATAPALPRARPRPGRVSGEDLGSDHAATWSSPNSPRAAIRACSSAVMIAGPSSPLRFSRVTRVPPPVWKALSVTLRV